MMSKKRPTHYINKVLKIVTVVLLIILLLLLLWDLRMYQIGIAKNIDQQNKTIHKLQLELETVKSLNSNLVKHLATQQSRISVLETNTTEQLTLVEQPIVHKAPVETPETNIVSGEKVKSESSYMDYIPFEMITVAVGSLELLRQIVMPKWSFN